MACNIINLKCSCLSTNYCNWLVPALMSIVRITVSNKFWLFITSFQYARIHFQGPRRYLIFIHQSKKNSTILPNKRFDSCTVKFAASNQTTVDITPVQHFVDGVVSKSHNAAAYERHSIEFHAAIPQRCCLPDLVQTRHEEGVGNGSVWKLESCDKFSVIRWDFDRN